jgi:hypothetical protein
VVPLKKQLYALSGDYIQQECDDNYVKVYKKKEKCTVDPGANYILLALEEELEPCGYKQGQEAGY